MGGSYRWNVGEIAVLVRELVLFPFAQLGTARPQGLVLTHLRRVETDVRWSQEADTDLGTSPERDTEGDREAGPDS